mmetsp:Transcript_13235/g.24847  ORF Transcript_13235/g.24847 Transcript_13235/m.24847 type:complete len:120 (-) Transcript_13235:150-509(-)
MTFLVTGADGSRIIKSQRICGPKVATLNATLMFSLVRIVDMMGFEAAVTNNDDDEDDRNVSIRLLEDGFSSIKVLVTKLVAVPLGIASKWVQLWKNVSRWALLVPTLPVRLKCSKLVGL